MPTPFTAPNPAEAAKVALLNAAAEAAAQEAEKALQTALAGTKSDNFNHFLSLVEAACVSEGRAATAKAAAKAAANMDIAQYFDDLY